jgi:ribosomal protein S4
MNKYPNKNRFKIIYQLKENVLESPKVINKKKYLNKKWNVYHLKSCPVFKSNFHFNCEKRLSLRHSFKNKILFKKKIKYFYGYLKEYQLKKYFYKSKKLYKFIIKKNVLQSKKNRYLGKIEKRFFFSENLERRFNIVCFRLKFVPSIGLASQLISHGFFKINGDKCLYGNKLLKPGDSVSINPLKIDKLKKILNKYPKKLYNRLLLRDNSGYSFKVRSYRNKNTGIFLDIPLGSDIKYVGKRFNFLDASLLF